MYEHRAFSSVNNSFAWRPHGAMLGTARGGLGLAGGRCHLAPESSTGGEVLAWSLLCRGR